MIRPGSLTADKIIRQRCPADSLGGDCGLAAFATVLGRSYADTAALLGCALDPKTGSMIGRRCVFDNEIAWACYSAGLYAMPLYAAESSRFFAHPETWGRPMLPTASELIRHIKGRVAIVTLAEGEPDSAELHSCPWDGVNLFDCNDGSTLDIAESGVAAALLISPMGER